MLTNHKAHVLILVRGSSHRERQEESQNAVPAPEGCAYDGKTPAVHSIQHYLPRAFLNKCIHQPDGARIIRGLYYHRRATDCRGQPRVRVHRSTVQRVYSSESALSMAFVSRSHS